MCRKLMFLISLVFVLAFVSVASAADYHWTNDYVWSSLYISPWNWDPVAPYGGPGEGDTAWTDSSELPLIIDGEVSVRRIRTKESDAMTVYLIGDANVFVQDFWRMEDSDGLQTVTISDNAKLYVGADDDWSLRWRDGTSAVLNITGDAEVTLEGDIQAAYDDDETFELNMDSGYLAVNTETDDDGWRHEDGQATLNFSGDAVIECDGTEWRASDDANPFVATLTDDVLFVSTNELIVGRGEGSATLTVDGNAVLVVEDEVRLGDDDNFAGLSTLNMLGGEIICEQLKAPENDESSGFSQINLFGGVITAEERSHETDNWKMEIEAGMMVLNGDVTEDAEADTFAGRISAYHTRGDVVIDYDAPGYTDKTRIRAIPKLRRAWNPSPTIGETDVLTSGTVLSWNAGDFAVIHHVFLSDNQALVESRSIGVYKGGLATTSLALPPLQLGTTYYWVVDEQDEAVIIEDGLLWSFTTEASSVVEGFEGYTTNPNYIFDAWIDGCGDVNGVGGNGTGSCVDLALDQSHGGTKSMLYGYDNTGSERDANYSEATLTYSEAQDWTASGEKALVLYFRGNAENDSSELWIILNGNVGAIATYGDNGMGDDPEDIKTAEWTEWNIDLADLTAGGVDLTNVTSISIGMGDKVTEVGGGVGSIHIDDLGLYTVRCVPKYTPDIFDTNADCVVDGKDIGIVADNWLDDLR